MLRSTLLAGAALMLFAAPALAAHCPKDAAAIEAALPKSNLSDAEKAEVTQLKEQGMAAHNAGNHRESEALLADAMRRILNGM